MFVHLNKLKSILMQMFCFATSKNILCVCVAIEYCYLLHMAVRCLVGLDAFFFLVFTVLFFYRVNYTVAPRSQQAIKTKKWKGQQHSVT